MDLARENQALSKQLEDAKKDKEKERESRNQTLEKIIERQRETIKKPIQQSLEYVIQQQSKVSDELDKHKQALKNLTGESMDQLLSRTHLPDFTAAYLQAVDEFERGARSELGASGVADASALDASISGSVGSGPAATSLPSASLSTSSPVVGKAEEEGRLVLWKITFETRKTGRKLVRPRITKPEVPLADVEMQDMDVTINSGRHTTPQKAETLDNATLPTQPAIRKRPSAVSTSNLQVETPATDETCSEDVAQPALKKSKGPEAPQESGEEKAVGNAEISKSLPTVEEHDAGDAAQDLKEEANDTEMDETTPNGEQVEEPAVVAVNQAQSQVDGTDVVNDTVVRPSEESTPDNESNFQVEGEQLAVDERDEVELTTDPDDVGNLEGGSNLSMGSPDILELRTDNLAGTDEDFLLTTTDTGEIESSQLPDDDKSEEVNATEELANSSDKLNDGGDLVASETDEAVDTVVIGEKPSNSTPVDNIVSKEGGPGDSPTAETEGKQVSPVSRSSRTINLNERAREKASLRQAGMPTPTSMTRGRGRVPLIHGGRSGRSGRGQNFGPQG